MATKKTKPATKKTSTKASSPAPVEQQSAQQVDRQEKIAFEAYLRAEQRGFQNGDPLTDWLEAEAEVDRILH